MKSNASYFTLILLFYATIGHAQFSGGNGNGFERSGAVVASLPLNLIEFIAEPSPDNRVHLSWITEDEVDTEIIHIQRSADGKRFSTIATLPAAGNAAGKRLHYQYTDGAPLPYGTSYYRLVVNDYDGSQTFSEMVAVSFASPAARLTVYPNPKLPHAPLTVAAGDALLTRVRITDGRGRVVVDRRVRPTAAITLRDALNRPGIYTLSVYGADAGAMPLAVRRLLVPK